MKGYCCQCGTDVKIRLVKGDVIYPHRPDLYDKTFAQCPACNNYVGIFEGESIVIPTKHIRLCRHKAHRMLDTIWKNRKKKGEYYRFMSDFFKKDFHWGMVKNEGEANDALTKTIEFLEKE